MDEVDGAVVVVVVVVVAEDDDSVLHRMEFLERGVDEPVSRRRSKLVPVLATWYREFSGDSKSLGACP